MNLSITVRGLEQVRAKFGKGADSIIKALTRGVAEDIRARIAKYPGPVKYPILWTSNRQRRAYFAKRGGDLPYTRQSDTWSQRLGPSWATENRGVDAVVGTRVTYAPWVQSKEKQQPMHAKTGWITDEEAIQASMGARVPERILEEVLRKW